MAEAKYTPRLKQHYNDNVKASLQKKFAYKNPMMTPKIEKVVINMGSATP